MGKQLILTEKPSVGREFASALGCNQKKEGYIEGDDVIVTWAIGHLLELIPPEGYHSDLKQWTFETLPIIPEQFRYRSVNSVSKQLSTVTSLLKRKDIDSLVIATDAGREGELIARLIINHAGFKKTMYRFWTSQALNKKIIQYGVKKALKPASEFDRLFKAGYQRSIADWLVGMNLTRAATLKMGNNGVFSVGRVQTAVLALLVDRRRHRENFTSVPYWIFKVHFTNEKGQWIGSWFKGTGSEKETRFWSKDEARRIAVKVNKHPGKIISVTKKQKKTAPPQLYSLTVLQKDANKLYGFTAKHTLDVAQALYEQHKALSYPRTDSQVLGAKNVDMVRNLVSRLSFLYNDLFENIDYRLIDIKNKRVFNDAKLTDPHALIPLKAGNSHLSHDGRRIYEMVLRRFVAVFHPNYEYESTEIITEVNGETFQTNGSIVLKPGWKALYKSTSDSKKETLPPLAKGDPATIEKMEGEQGQTQPMPEYTEASLLDDMSNPAKYVEEALKEIYRGEIGLGTQATRAATIELLLKREYVSRNKKQLLATDKGCSLIDFLRKLPISGAVASPTETAKWEQTLNAIAFGGIDDFIFKKQIRQFVFESIKEFKGAQGIKVVSPFGKCPACGAGITKGKKGYGCSNWRDGCKFVIWKTINSAHISEDVVKTLLAGKITKEIEFVSKKGAVFKTPLKLEQEKDEWRVKFQFNNNPFKNSHKTSDD